MAPKKILVIDTYYPTFLKAKRLNVMANKEVQVAKVDAEVENLGFGTGATYVRELRDLGWEAKLIVANALMPQSAWANANAKTHFPTLFFSYGIVLARVPIIRRFIHLIPGAHKVLFDQIKHTKPDVVYVQDINFIPFFFAKAIKKYCRILVGEIASPPPPKEFFANYDLIVSALPSIVEMVAGWGIPSKYLPLGFEIRNNFASNALSRDIDVLFVGSFSRHQPQTAALLRDIAERNKGLRIYGPVKPSTLRRYKLSEFYFGEAWGLEMFRLLARSKVAINRHGPISGRYAVNMRMFESTGNGALLVTETKDNIRDFFEPDIEILTYSSNREAAEKIESVLKNEPLLKKISTRGQQRTFKQHTYRQRISLLDKWLRAALEELR